MQQIEIKDSSTGKLLLFPCNRWLSKDKEDGEIIRELYPQINEDEKMNSSTSRGSNRSPKRFSDYNDDYNNSSFEHSNRNDKGSFRSESASSRRDNMRKNDRYEIDRDLNFSREKGSLSRSDRDLYYR